MGSKKVSAQMCVVVSTTPEQPETVQSHEDRGPFVSHHTEGQRQVAGQVQTHQARDNDPREDELKSVCSPEIKKYIQKKGLILINWSSLSS